MSEGNGIGSLETSTPKITLAIIFDPTTGALQVTGPIDNQLLCFGLLELAKENLKIHAANQAKRIVGVPPGMRIARG